MLQAYIDDSKQDSPGLYVLAGYVADESKWLDFDREWKEFLAGPPRLHHLKTSDMFQTRNRKSVFYRWSREEVDARVLRLATTVNKYVLASIQTAIRKEDYANILGGLPNDDPSMNRPYPFLFFSIIQGLVSRLEDMGFTRRLNSVSIFSQTRRCRRCGVILRSPGQCIKAGWASELWESHDLKTMKKLLRSKRPI
jgi:hypothetical protein